MAVVAAAVLDPTDPEVAGWISDARATFERLRARPMLALLDRIAAAGSPAARGGRSDMATPVSGADQPASVSST